MFPAGFEIRQEGDDTTITGRFPYSSPATVADRGTVRKESFEPGSMRFAIEDAERDIHLLVGHSFDRPLASKLAGSLVLADTAEGVTFRATLPRENLRPMYMNDAVAMLGAGLVGGISPGFSVPPKSAVPNAESTMTEAAFNAEHGLPAAPDPNVRIRLLRAVVLHELSLVTRPVYKDTDVAVRAMLDTRAIRRYWL